MQITPIQPNDRRLVRVCVGVCYEQPVRQQKICGIK